MKSILSFVLIVISIVFLSVELSSQETDGSLTIDFLEIERGDSGIKEGSFTNESEKTIFFLRVDNDADYLDIKTNTKSVEPGGKLDYRIKVNASSKGKFKTPVDFIFGEKTIRLTVKGDVKYVNTAGHSPCPDFDTPADQRVSDWTAYFKVVDRDTGKPLPETELSLSGKANPSKTIKTDSKGEIEVHLPIDFYSISAKKKGYASYSMESYINRNNNSFKLELMAGEMGSVVRLEPRKKAPKVESIVLSEEEDQVIEEKETSLLLVPQEFSLNEFKKNNVVFLIDISTSMRKEQRLETLKSAMKELVGMLRKDDVLSLVTYASKTEVVLSGESAGDDTKILEAIESLEAEGLSAGEAGLKLAYRICEKHFIEQGNNQVYLATDGAFNKGDTKVNKLAKKEAHKGVKLSVIAIKSRKWANDRMTDLAKDGSGDHIHLEDETTEGLKDLVKNQSRK